MSCECGATGMHVVTALCHPIHGPAGAARAQWNRDFNRHMRRIHKRRCPHYATCACGVPTKKITEAFNRGLTALEAAKELA